MAGHGPSVECRPAASHETGTQTMAKPPTESRNVKGGVSVITERLPVIVVAHQSGRWAAWPREEVQRQHTTPQQRYQSPAGLPEAWRRAPAPGAAPPSRTECRHERSSVPHLPRLGRVHLQRVRQQTVGSVTCPCHDEQAPARSPLHTCTARSSTPHHGGAACHAAGLRSADVLQWRSWLAPVATVSRAPPR